MIQNKYTEICCISIHLYWTIRKRNQEYHPISNDIKKNKTPRNKFNQMMNDLHSENYKTLMREIEDDTNKWKLSCAHELEALK